MSGTFDLGISADCTRITGKPEVIPGQTGSRTCQWLDVPDPLSGTAAVLPTGQISLRVFPLRRDGRPAKPRATKVPIEPTLLRMECHYCAITSESTRRRLCQNFAEAAGDNHILARLQHPNTHHNLVSVFGNTSASLRGAGCGI